MVKALAPPQSPSWWLPKVVAVLGPPEIDPELRRWTWQDGDIGVFIDKLTHVWQTVAWSPECSVTLRGRQCPTDADMAAIIALAELTAWRPAEGAP